MNTTLNRLIKIFVLLGVPFLGMLYAYQFIGQDREQIVPFKPFKAPPLKVKTPNGELKEYSFEEPITLVNFWATWCPPCIEEFPAMIELQRQLENKGVEIVFVSVDDKWELVPKFLKENGLVVGDSRLFWDESKANAAQWGSAKFPESYVVRKDGWVVEKIIGAQRWTRPASIKYFEDLGIKFKKLVARLGWLIPSAYAAGEKDLSSSDLSTVHEEDRKTIQKLRQNIETASKNLRTGEAGLREEERNFSEQKVVLERRIEEEKAAKAELEKLKSKNAEVASILKKNQALKGSESIEKQRIERRIKDIEARIASLEKQLSATRDELTQANKELNTRLQQMETVEEAQKSSEEELKELEGRVASAEKELQKRAQESKTAKLELAKREQKLKELRGQVDRFNEVLTEQKRTLEQFEKILKR